MGFVVNETGGGLLARVDARAVGQAIGGFPEQFGAAMRRGFVRGGVMWERSMKQSFEGYSGRSPAGGLQNRSGNLRRTIQYRVNGNSLRSLSLHLIAGDNRTPYALAMERGAVITPKTAKALTIPLSEALTPSGVVRGDSIIRKTADGYETDRGPTFILTPFRGAANSFVMVKGPNGLIPLYVLKGSVTIPGPDTDGSESKLGAERRARHMIANDLVEEINAAARLAWERGRSSPGGTL